VKSTYLSQPRHSRLLERIVRPHPLYAEELVDYRIVLALIGEVKVTISVSCDEALFFSLPYAHI